MKLNAKVAIGLFIGVGIGYDPQWKELTIFLPFIVIMVSKKD